MDDASAMCRVLLELVDHLDAMVAVWDADERCVFANSAYKQWFGHTRAELLGTTLAELLGPELYAQNLPYLRAAYAGEKQVFERAIPLPDGSIRHSLATYTPYVVDGVQRGIFVHAADVEPFKRLEHDLRVAKDEAERLATHDPLTGLPNRMLLFDRIRHAIAVSHRSGGAVALISLDIDDFKAINDRYGHVAGDAVLVAVAGRVRGAMRESDSVTRLGGDEFVLLAPEVRSPDEASAIAQRVIEQVGMPVVFRDASIAVSLSVGIALHPPHAADPGQLLESSDQALYAAKRLGRHRIAFADTPPARDGRR